MVGRGNRTPHLWIAGPLLYRLSSSNYLILPFNFRMHKEFLLISFIKPDARKTFSNSH